MSTFNNTEKGVSAVADPGFPVGASIRWGGGGGSTSDAGTFR